MAASMLKTVTTRLLIISDTHSTSPFPSSLKTHAFRHPLPRTDILLHAGDLSLTGALAEYSPTISFIAAAHAELKLVIAGNHDLTLDADFQQRESNGKGEGDTIEAKKIWTSEAARAAGIVYLEEGVRTFTLKSGARFTIYVSPYQPEFCNMAFNYPRSQDRFNPPSAFTPIPSFPAIDVVMTHGPPRGILDKVTRNERVGCPHLLRAISRARPRLHCFGHIHESWGAERVRWEERGEEEAGYREGEWKIGKRERFENDSEETLRERAVCMDVGRESREPLVWGQETLFVNASVMTWESQPLQAPWRIDIELPLAATEQAEA
ncbi:MAG: hypothetical protein M1840_006963 [Geoglossum simile]|nr:MAG: hypothetical protein M1840_006963 [Geoglossum simile]